MYTTRGPVVGLWSDDAHRPDYQRSRARGESRGRAPQEKFSSHKQTRVRRHAKTRCGEISGAVRRLSSPDAERRFSRPRERDVVDDDTTRKTLRSEGVGNDLKRGERVRSVKVNPTATHDALKFHGFFFKEIRKSVIHNLCRFGLLCTSRCKFITSVLLHESTVGNLVYCHLRKGVSPFRLPIDHFTFLLCATWHAVTRSMLT